MRFKEEHNFINFEPDTRSRNAERISLGDGADYANIVGFRGLVPLLPHLCPLSVPEVGVCGVYSESP